MDEQEKKEILDEELRKEYADKLADWTPRDEAEVIAAECRFNLPRPKKCQTK